MHPRELLREEGNETCVDCRSGQATWASVNLGILVCIDCSGVHRSLGTHISVVKSVTLDSWRPEWIAQVQKIGNNRANAFFERHVPPKYAPLYARRGASRAERERYIKLKYVRRRFCSGEAPHELIAKGLAFPAEYPQPEAGASDDEEDTPAVEQGSRQISEHEAASRAAQFANPHGSSSQWALPFAPPAGLRGGSDGMDGNDLGAAALFEKADAGLKKAVEKASPAIDEVQRRSTEAAQAAWEKVPSRGEVKDHWKTAKRAFKNTVDSETTSDSFAKAYTGFASGFKGLVAAAAAASAPPAPVPEEVMRETGSAEGSQHDGAAASAAAASAAASSSSRSQASEGANDLGGLFSGLSWKTAQASLKVAAKRAQADLKTGLGTAKEVAATTAAGATDLLQSVDKLVVDAMNQADIPSTSPASAAGPPGLDVLSQSQRGPASAAGDHTQAPDRGSSATVFAPPPRVAQAAAQPTPAGAATAGAAAVDMLDLLGDTGSGTSVLQAAPTAVPAPPPTQMAPPCPPPPEAAAAQEATASLAAPPAPAFAFTQAAAPAPTAPGAAVEVDVAASVGQAIASAASATSTAEVHAAPAPEASAANSVPPAPAAPAPPAAAQAVPSVPSVPAAPEPKPVQPAQPPVAPQPPPPPPPPTATSALPGEGAPAGAAPAPPPPPTSLPAAGEADVSTEAAASSLLD